MKPTAQIATKIVNCFKINPADFNFIEILASFSTFSAPYYMRKKM